MGECQYGSSSKPGAIPHVIIRNGQILSAAQAISNFFRPGRGGTNRELEQRIRDRYFTNDLPRAIERQGLDPSVIVVAEPISFFCDGPPEELFNEYSSSGRGLLQRDPLSLIALRRLIYSLWRQNCRCNPPPIPECVPPFTGGQCRGVEYVVKYKVTWYRDDEVFEEGDYVGIAVGLPEDEQVGPIRWVGRTVQDGLEGPAGYTSAVSYPITFNGQQAFLSLLGSTSRFIGLNQFGVTDDFVVSEFGVFRRDGLPDVCGDPPLPIECYPPPPPPPPPPVDVEREGEPPDMIIIVSGPQGPPGLPGRPGERGPRGVPGVCACPKLPPIKLPDIKLPNIRLPDITLRPNVVIPVFRPTVVVRPTINLPAIRLPTIRLPNINLNPGNRGRCPDISFTVSQGQSWGAEVIRDTVNCRFVLRLQVPRDLLEMAEVEFNGAIRITNCEGGDANFFYEGTNFEGVRSFFNAFSAAFETYVDDQCIPISGEYELPCQTQDEEEANFFIDLIAGILANQIVDRIILALGITVTGLVATIILQVVSGYLTDALKEFFLSLIPTGDGAETAPFDGRGLIGVSRQIDALSKQVETLSKKVCEDETTEEPEDEAGNCVVLLPAAPYDDLNLETQLVIKFGQNYPTNVGSRWDIHVPNPIEGLSWCVHFEPLVRTVVDKDAATRWCGRQYWGNAKTWTGGYFDSRENAIAFLDAIVALSTATPGKRTVTERIKVNGLEMGAAVREVRAVRAVVAEIDSSSGKNEISKIRCYSPPPEGCEE